jgi:hypothetical protein
VGRYRHGHYAFLQVDQDKGGAFRIELHGSLRETGSE